MMAWHSKAASRQVAVGQRIVAENLSFNIAQLLKDPIGATRAGDVEVKLARLIPDLEQEPEAPEAVLSGSVRLMHTQGGVLVQGKLRTEASVPCSRCLQPVVVPLDVELEEIFAPTIDVVSGRTLAMEEQDRALWIDEHHVLDMTEVLRQGVLVALPMHVFCQEDCKGLCSVCGQNLNEGDCGCEPEPDPRWSALLNMLEE